MELTETIYIEACSNNRLGYVVIWAATRPSYSNGAHSGVGLGSQERPNGWGSESMRFHGLNVVSCKIVWKLSDVEEVRGKTTV